jgi:hypothetical protein
MVKVKVKTIWQGKIGIREKYFTEALNKNEPVILIHGDESMTIPSNEISKRVKGVSATAFKDRFSRDKHHLIHYEWKPDIKQVELF